MSSKENFWDLTFNDLSPDHTHKIVTPINLEYHHNADLNFYLILRKLMKNFIIRLVEK